MTRSLTAGEPIGSMKVSAGICVEVRVCDAHMSVITAGSETMRPFHC